MRDLNWRDFGGEPASLGRSDRLLIRANTVFVLVLTGKPMVVRALLSLKAHVLLLVCVRKTIFQDTIHERLVSKLGACPQHREVVGRVRHALCAAGDNDIGIPGDDCLRADDERLDRGGADLVDGGGYSRLGESCANCALASGVLSEAVVCIRRSIMVAVGSLTWLRGHCLRRLPQHPRASIRRAQQQLGGHISVKCPTRDHARLRIPLIAWEPS